jgi:hypothetical protein
VATGERSRDLAVRLRYAGVEYLRVPDLVEAVSAAGSAATAAPDRDTGLGGSGRPHIDVVANYTAFHQLAARLGERLTPEAHVERVAVGSGAPG